MVPEDRTPVLSFHLTSMQSPHLLSALASIQDLGITDLPDSIFLLSNID